MECFHWNWMSFLCRRQNVILGNIKELMHGVYSDAIAIWTGILRKTDRGTKDSHRKLRRKTRICISWQSCSLLSPAALRVRTSHCCLSLMNVWNVNRMSAPLQSSLLVCKETRETEQGPPIFGDKKNETQMEHAVLLCCKIFFSSFFVMFQKGCQKMRNTCKKDHSEQARATWRRRGTTMK